MAKKQQNNETLTREEYTKKLHRIGTTTMIVLAVITFFPALYLCVFADGFPGWGILTGSVAVAAGKEAFAWFFEPIIQFPMLGVAGMYIASTAGNGTSIRIPAAMSAQNAIEAKTGTRKAEVASVIGMVASVLVSLSALIIVILFGNYLLTLLPEAVRDAFDYAIPAVYGAVVVVMTSAIAKSRGKD